MPNKCEYMPTAEQIAAECELIRAEWNELEKEKRTTGGIKHWMPPGAANAEILDKPPPYRKKMTDKQTERQRAH
jgi:hypothetical protein